MVMTYAEAREIAAKALLPKITARYGLSGYSMTQISPHEGGRNLVYICEKDGLDAKIIRIAFLNDRGEDDFLAELEYVRYLSEHGANVSNVISSRSGDLMEEMLYENHTFSVCLFERARGKMLVENNYRYREGVPIAEYFHNCGKTLGKLHQLSKEYHPVHRRYSFSDKYSGNYIAQLIPASLPLLKEKMRGLLKTLEGLDRDQRSFGMVHFDYGDGNYMIDFDTGDITVYDFDDSCFCWYMFDLASTWRNGVGWVQFERDAAKRKKFMADYFETILTGYRSETVIEDSLLEQLPLFIQVVLMENIVSEFECMRNNGEALECDETLLYMITCMEEDIPYLGFFNNIYSCEEPFSHQCQR